MRQSCDPILKFPRMKALDSNRTWTTRQPQVQTYPKNTTHFTEKLPRDSLYSPSEVAIKEHRGTFVLVSSQIHVWYKFNQINLLRENRPEHSLHHLTTGSYSDKGEAEREFLEPDSQASEELINPKKTTSKGPLFFHLLTSLYSNTMENPSNFKL